MLNTKADKLLLSVYETARLQGVPDGCVGLAVRETVGVQRCVAFKGCPGVIVALCDSAESERAFEANLHRKPWKKLTKRAASLQVDRQQVGKTAGDNQLDTCEVIPALDDRNPSGYGKKINGEKLQAVLFGQLLAKATGAAKASVEKLAKDLQPLVVSVGADGVLEPSTVASSSENTSSEKAFQPASRGAPSSPMRGPAPAVDVLCNDPDGTAGLAVMRGLVANADIPSLATSLLAHPKKIQAECGGLWNNNQPEPLGMQGRVVAAVEGLPLEQFPGLHGRFRLDGANVGGRTADLLPLNPSFADVLKKNSPNQHGSVPEVLAEKLRQFQTTSLAVSWEQANGRKLSQERTLCGWAYDADAVDGTPAVWVNLGRAPVTWAFKRLKKNNAADFTITLSPGDAAIRWGQKARCEWCTACVGLGDSATENGKREDVAKKGVLDLINVKLEDHRALRSKNAALFDRLHRSDATLTPDKWFQLEFELTENTTTTSTSGLEISAFWPGSRPAKKCVDVQAAAPASKAEVNSKPRSGRWNKRRKTGDEETDAAPTDEQPGAPSSFAAEENRISLKSAAQVQSEQIAKKNPPPKEDQKRGSGAVSMKSAARVAAESLFADLQTHMANDDLIKGWEAHRRTCNGKARGPLRAAARDIRLKAQKAAGETSLESSTSGAYVAALRLLHTELARAGEADFDGQLRDGAAWLEEKLAKVGSAQSANKDFVENANNPREGSTKIAVSVDESVKDYPNLLARLMKQRASGHRGTAFTRDLRQATQWADSCRARWQKLQNDSDQQHKQNLQSSYLDAVQHLCAELEKEGEPDFDGQLRRAVNFLQGTKMEYFHPGLEPGKKKTTRSYIG
eukprot:GSA120T00005229001.1